MDYQASQQYCHGYKLHGSFVMYKASRQCCLELPSFTAMLSWIQASRQFRDVQSFTAVLFWITKLHGSVVTGGLIYRASVSMTRASVVSQVCSSFCLVFSPQNLIFANKIIKFQGTCKVKKSKIHRRFNPPCIVTNLIILTWIIMLENSLFFCFFKKSIILIFWIKFILYIYFE